MVVATVTAGFRAEDVGQNFKPRSVIYCTPEQAEAPGVGGGHTTFEQGRLTSEGFELLGRMADLGFVWDISQFAEEGVWQGLDLGFSRVCASHANARSLTPTDRHLDDEVIRALAERGGVIGLVLYNRFLDPGWNRAATVPVTLREHLRRHASHVAGIQGWKHVGIGSDLDGGFGLEESPQEIDSVADLREAGAAVPAEHREAALSTNWLRFLRSSLPRTS